MTVNCFVLLILVVFASEENGLKYGEKNERIDENSVVVKIEEDEYAKMDKKSAYIGVNYRKDVLKWSGHRWSKFENKFVHYGCYDDEETAAHASDTLARKLLKNGEQNHKLNFPDDDTRVHWEKKTSSKFIGVWYNKNNSNWRAQRWSKNENKCVSNGHYNDEEKAAHASDNLARKMMENGKQNLKLNFPDDNTEVYPDEKKKGSKFIGVSYNKKKLKWQVGRRSKKENKLLSNGCYDNEETAAQASDSLARNLMKNGEQGHKLNLPDDRSEAFLEKQNTKRKRLKN